MDTYFLPKHVFFCFSGDYCVFLDLKRDRYSCVSRSDAQLLDGCVPGWPSHAARTQPDLPEHESAARAMLEGGLLTPYATEGKSAEPLPICAPTCSLAGQDGRVPLMRGITATDAVLFLASAASTSLRLRKWPIDRIVRRVQTRRLRARRKAASIGRIREKVAVFNALRPFFPVSGKGCCLFDSLALLEFLSRYGLFPLWVFGVRTEPFYAHCWLQHEGVLLNGPLEQARSYTPILAA
jgi:hypothetical protein